MIRKIVVPVRGDGKGDNVLSHAAALARRFDAHIVVTHCRPRPEDMLPFGIPIPAILKNQLLEQATSLADVEESGMIAELDTLAAKLGLTITDNPDWTRPTVQWVEETGKQVDVIKRHGRLTDLIAVAQPDVTRNLGTNTLKAALFRSGRPVMMCPSSEKAPQTLGSKIAIAWNGSLEATRAVALLIDFIAQADEVTILSGGDEVPGATSEDLVHYLALRGIEATAERFAAKGNVGDELLALSAKADLMIMGAYGESHERETVFGGNTQTVVDKATIPVIMVH